LFYKQTKHWKRAMKPISSYSLFQTQLFVGGTVRQFSLFLSHRSSVDINICGKQNFSNITVIANLAPMSLRLSFEECWNSSSVFRSLIQL